MGKRRKSNKHLPRRMYLKSGSYYFVSPQNKWVCLGRDYPAAMAAYGKLTDENPHCMTVNDLIDRYCSEVAPAKAPASHRCNLASAKLLKAFFGKMQIQKVAPKHVYMFKDLRKDSPVRANRDIAMLSVVYKYALEWGYIDRIEMNPCKGVARFPEKKRDRYVENHEYLAFKEFAGPMLAGFMDFKLLTGLRQTDILGMRMDQLREDGIHVQTSKTGKRQIIEWSDNLQASVAALRALRRPVTGMYLLVNRNGQPYTMSGFCSMWGKRMRKAVEQRVLTEPFRANDLRTKTATDTDFDHAKGLLGHSDGKTTQKYYRMKPEKVTPLK